MPIEFRQITFTNHELRAALDDFFLRRNSPLPSGAILGVRWDGSEHEHVIVEISAAQRSEQVTVTVANRDAGAALLRYCFLNKIPLPRASQKSLAISGKNLVLELRSGSTSSESERRLTG
jgi:hypothetical protein